MALKLISDNPESEKPKSKLRRAPKVSPFCPVCGSSVWFYVNISPADVITKLQKARCCAHCMAQNKVTTW